MNKISEFLVCAVLEYFYIEKGVLDMEIVCLDLEGVLVPEIWIAFAQASGIPELKRTTRDEPDYDKLMQYRIDILKRTWFGIERCTRCHRND